jgi:hypothetical protein
MKLRKSGFVTILDKRNKTQISFDFSVAAEIVLSLSDSKCSSDEAVRRRLDGLQETNHRP